MKKTIEEFIGNTPLVRLQRLHGADKNVLWAKLEGNNPAGSVKDMTHKGLIEYVPFPPGLLDKYQSFTQADLSRLRAAGYQREFRTVEQGVAEYVAVLQKS